jgi:hypothetical protein
MKEVKFFMKSSTKSFLIGNLFVFVGLLLAFIALFLPFANGITNTDQTAYTFIFGYKGSGWGGAIGSAVYPSLSVALTGWIFLLIGFILAVAIVPLAFLTKNGLRIGRFTFGQVLGAFAALLLVVAGILFFFPAAQYTSYLGANKGDYGLGVGFWLTAIFSILGGVCCVLPLFVTIKK